MEAKYCLAESAVMVLTALDKFLFGMQFPEFKYSSSSSTRRQCIVLHGLQGEFK